MKRLLKTLTVVVLVLAGGACAHPGGASDTPGDARVVIDAQGVIRVDDDPVTRDALPDALRRARIAPERTLVVRYQGETGKRMIPELTARLRQAGYRRLLFSGERQASAKVTE